MRQAEGEDWGDDWEDDSIRELKQIFQVRTFKNDVDCSRLPQSFPIKPTAFLGIYESS